MVIGKVTTNKNAAHLLQFSKVHFISEWFLKCDLTTLFADNESGFSVTFKRMFKTFFCIKGNKSYLKKNSPGLSNMRWTL